MTNRTTSSVKSSKGVLQGQKKLEALLAQLSLDILPMEITGLYVILVFKNIGCENTLLV